VAKTLIDNGASLNLIMRKTFIEMGVKLKYLAPVHDMFHEVIPGQSSTPIGRIDLEGSCGKGDNKCREMLKFVVTNFDIRYNCILGRLFLLKFMVVKHTMYATMKMPGPKDVITIKVDQQDALSCQNTTLTHAERFDEKVGQEQTTKVAKTQGGSTPLRSPTSKPLAIDTPQPPSAKKTHICCLIIQSDARR
jgi:hypothetical protein